MVEFLSGNLPMILCALVGFALLLVEAFMPGFGIAGLLGIVLEVIAVYSAWVHHGMVFALIMTVIILAIIVLTVFLSYRSAINGRLSKSALVLQGEEKPVQELAAKTLMAWQGREGIAATPLRPAGTVEIDGTRINAASHGEMIEKGEKVAVTGAEGDHVVVKRLS